MRQMSKEGIAGLEASLVGTNDGDTRKVLLAIDKLFGELSGHAVIARQSASYPGFDLRLQQVLIDSTEILDGKISYIRSYLIKGVGKRVL